MDDLRVESYDPKEVEVKKQALLERGEGCGCAVVLVLSLFGLILFGGCDGGGSRRMSIPHYPYYIYQPLGGSGSWFISTVESV